MNRMQYVGRAVPADLPAAASTARPTAIRVLMIEDSADDAELITGALRKGGLSFTTERVESGPALRAALASFRPDIVLSDYRLPAFSGTAALSLIREGNPQLPVIIVTGALGDRTAVELIQGGASDYFLKDRLARLVPAIHRALAERQAGEQRRAAEAALHESQERFRQMAENIEQVFWLTDPGKAEMLYISPAYARIWGRSVDSLLASPMDWIQSVHADDRERVRGALGDQAAGRYDIEYRITRADGELRWIRDQAFPVRDAQGAVHRIAGVATDVTASKLQEQRIERLSRTHRVLSAINSLIVHARTRAELFQEACRIAVEDGGFRLAWIGAAAADGDVVPVVHHGDDRGQLQHLRFATSAAGPGSSGTVAEALRTGRLQICTDVLSGGEAAPEVRMLRDSGIGSFIVLPLRSGGRVSGCLALCAAECDFFDGEEVQLLEQLAGDVSHAMEYILKEQALDFIALYDPLTRLPNREFFLKRLRGFVDAAGAGGRSLAVVMLDLAHFKTLNDSLGQAAGDELLKAVAERVKHKAGGPSYAARLSADHFVVVVNDLDPAADAAALITAAGWDRLEPPCQRDGQDVPVSFRIGLAVYPQDATDGADLLRNAEAALKLGKAGGQTVTRYAAGMREAAGRRLLLETQLRRAVARGEFTLHYQPKVDLRSGAISGAEALLRWNCPELGAVSPTEFVPVLERSHLIEPVGRWVMQQALADRRAWLVAGLSPPPVAVNVSPVQLQGADFVNVVRAVLSDETAGIELEVTETGLSVQAGESAALNDAVAGKLRTLRDLGIRVSIDDFGTGYSSLSALPLLPVYALKIDRGFISKMTESGDSLAIISAVLALARSMNLKTIAEGVETQEQLKLLRLLGCDEIQGYLFSRPVPAAEFATMLRSGKRLAQGGPDG